MMVVDPLTNAAQHTVDAAHPLNLDAVRADFPLLTREVNGHPLIYLDNAATSQKPRQVLDAIVGYYSEVNSNVHRGVHTLSQAATDAYEMARATVTRFLNASHDHEIIFTAGTTHSINIVASAFAASELTAGDEVVVTEIEHHSNYVPWQQACIASGARLVVVEADRTGQIDLDDLERAISDRTRIVAITHVSNTLGTVIDLKRAVGIAHARGVPVLADGAQAVPHLQIDVAALGVDFYTFSGHKVYGPMGIGALYGSEHWLRKLRPFVTGGGMIDIVEPEATTWADLPHKHEAGTPNVAGAVGLAAALDYIESLGMDSVVRHEEALTEYTQSALRTIDSLEIFGPDSSRAGVFSFRLGNAHPFDVGSLLDQFGIAVRTGHHCNQPLMRRLGVTGTTRASIGLYNTRDEIDRLVDALAHVQSMVA